MAADYPATLRAAPLRRFPFQEPPDAILFDKFEVLYHAHMVIDAVALIEGLKAATGEIPAIIAEPHEAFPQQPALLFHEGTVLAARQAAGAVCLPKALLFQVVFHGQVAGADSAVHPARGNQFFFHLHLNLNMNELTLLPAVLVAAPGPHPELLHLAFWPKP